MDKFYPRLGRLSLTLLERLHFYTGAARGEREVKDLIERYHVITLVSLPHDMRA